MIDETDPVIVALRREVNDLRARLDTEPERAARASLEIMQRVMQATVPVLVCAAVRNSGRLL